MKHLIIAASFVAFWVGSAQAASYTQLVDFGDSLSDVGNIHALTTLGHSLDSNIPIVPGAPAYYNGRFSNGPIWVDQLAGLLGVPDPSPSSSSGTDYAYGNATSGTGNTQTYIPNILTQVGNWTSNHAGTSTQLFTLLGGANDIFNAISGGGTSAQQTAAAQQAADNIASGAQSLYAHGARHILVANLPDLGLIPHFYGTADQAQASSLTDSFNTELAADLTNLAGSSAGLSLYTLDLHTLFNEVIADPSAFGLTNVTGRAYTGDDDFLGNGTIVPDPSDYLFWDADHPTTVGHGLVAQAAYAVAVPEPSSLALLAAVLAIMIIPRRRGTENEGRHE